MIKIVTVIGARPQFIKAAILSKTFVESGKISEIVIHTGQHFDYNMNQIFFEELKIPKPKYQLNINSLSHGDMTGRMLSQIEKILILEKPDYVLVFGDTNSTLSGALAAIKLHISTIHVEAGLRSFNMRMPEEINRILTDRISEFLFCPTDKAVENLESEGFDRFSCKIVNCGDVMYDLALFMHGKEFGTLPSEIDLTRDYILCTIHREENTTDINKLISIFEGLNKISENIKIILPIHPRTKKIIEQNNLVLNFKTIEPIGYFQMTRLLQHCQLVITDSGGVQKEAYFFKKFCITLREETEWTELVDHGYNNLVGHDSNLIYNAYLELLNQNKSFAERFYGEGNACTVILNTILHHHSTITENE